MKASVARSCCLHVYFSNAYSCSLECRDFFLFLFLTVVFPLRNGLGWFPVRHLGCFSLCVLVWQFLVLNLFKILRSVRSLYTADLSYGSDPIGGESTTDCKARSAQRAGSACGVFNINFVLLVLFCEYNRYCIDCFIVVDKHGCVHTMPHFRVFFTCLVPESFLNCVIYNLW